MANIKASQPDVPLFEVVEHIVGDVGQVVLQYEELDPKESGLPQAAGVDLSDERVRAWVGNWEALLPVDGAIVQAWDHAWQKLRAAVRDGSLPLRGFKSGSEFLEEVKAAEFPEIWNNQFSASNFDVECSGNLFFDFDAANNARILKSQSIVAHKVIWTSLYAISGTDVLKLWPARKAQRLTDDQLRVVILNLVERLGCIPSQNKCAEIVLKDYPQEGRDRVRELFVDLYPRQKQGRGPRKKCAS
jgi:hypothetical protein